MNAKTPTRILAAALLGACLLQAPLAQAKGALPAIYNEQADARAELNQTLATAHAEHKRVLVVYGANWCPDCRALDGKLKHGELAQRVGKDFVVLKVDVGRFNHNLDLAAQMGVPLKKGIPTVAVLASDGSVLSATSGGELADARSMGDDAVLKVFEGLSKR